MFVKESLNEEERQRLAEMMAELHGLLVSRVSEARKAGYTD